jgi:hypothetical protein
MSELQAPTVPVSRIMESIVFCDGRQFGRSLKWTANDAIAPAEWLAQRQELRRGCTLPGEYREIGRIINAATSEEIESYDSTFRIHPEPSTEEPRVEPEVEFRRWQVALLFFLATPGVLAAIACLPFAAVIYLSCKVTVKTKRFIEFWQLP